MSLKWFLGAIATTGLIHSAHADVLKLKTPRGAELEVVANFPVNATGKLPVVIIAPGQGYHMNLPLTKGLAEAANKEGYISFQFNWAYFSKDPASGMPSDDLSLEAEDMQTVLEFAKKDHRVDANKIILAGKSIGTLVSYSVFKADPSLKGLILLTPLCTQNKVAIGEEAYPQFSQETRPISIIVGNQDSACELPMLYDFAKSSPGNVAINVFGGGHSLTFGTFGDPKNADKDAKNIDAAISTAVLWSKIIFEK